MPLSCVRALRESSAGDVEGLQEHASFTNRQSLDCKPWHLDSWIVVKVKLTITDHLRPLTAIYSAATWTPAQAVVRGGNVAKAFDFTAPADAACRLRLRPQRIRQASNVHGSGWNLMTRCCSG